MTITLITGANKGLGYETARRLIDLGHTVLAGARDLQRGSKAAHELGATFIDIDPTDDDSVKAAAARVRGDFGHLDVLINNAGTAAPRLGPEELTADAAMEGFAINVFGPIRVTHAFLPLLRAAAHPRIVNVSSGVGSFQRILDPSTVESAVTLPVYPATKAALTMLTVQYARALQGILVNAAHSRTGTAPFPGSSRPEPTMPGQRSPTHPRRPWSTCPSLGSNMLDFYLGLDRVRLWSISCG